MNKIKQILSLFLLAFALIAVTAPFITSMGLRSDNQKLVVAAVLPSSLRTIEDEAFRPIITSSVLIRETRMKTD